MIPRVEDLASIPLVHRFGDLFNPPALTNFRGSVQAAIDVTGIRALNFPPFSSSDSFPPITWSHSVTGALFVDGRYFGATGEPVTFTWRPDRIERSAKLDGLSLSSETILAVGQMAALVRLRVVNLTGARRTVRLRFGLKSTITMSAWDWTRPVGPSEYDNEAVLDQERKAVLFRARHSPAVSLQGIVPRAEKIDGNGVETDRELAAGDAWQIVYLNVIAEDPAQAHTVYDDLAGNVTAEFERAHADWNQELEAAFTPGNDRYSGSLPRLETTDDDVRRLYHQGMLATVYFKREMPVPHIGRTYTTLMPRYWQTITWLWDYQLGSMAHVMLDPAVATKLLGTWMASDIHQFMGTDWLTGQGVGEEYTVNDYAICKIAYDYVRWSGDAEWLRQEMTSVAGERLRRIERMSEYARHWHSLKGPFGLADYGDLRNLLECVDTYAHEVAGLNAANVSALRITAELLELLGERDAARALRTDADGLVDKIQTLYVEGQGCWHARHPGGELVPVRHCFDLLAVLNTIGTDLSERQRAEMVRLFRQELRTPTWMHALSPCDGDAIFDIRPDHQWTGAYAAWPAEMLAALFRCGEVDLAFDWLRGLAVTARQGPFGQAHFVESIVAPEDGGARKAPSEFPFLTDWACAAGAAWAAVVVESIFGVEATLADGLRASPHVEHFDREARLVNVPYQGALYTVDRDGARRQEGPA